MNSTDNDNTAIDEKQFVSFLIGRETYGVAVLKVQEIIGTIEITPVPNTPPFVRGVINLRGSVVPVVDMRRKFNLEEQPYDNTAVTIIVEVKDRLIGMIVDSVSDVINIDVSEIQSTPHFAGSADADFVQGIGQLNDRLIIILDVDKILSDDEMANIDGGQGQEEDND